MKHTPTPWEVEDGFESLGILYNNPKYDPSKPENSGFNAKKKVLLSMDDFHCGDNGGYTISAEQDRANAAFIVKACNLHEELVESVKDFVAKLEAQEKHSPIEAQWLLDARAILKKAGEGL